MPAPAVPATNALIISASPAARLKELGRLDAALRFQQRARWGYHDSTDTAGSVEWSTMHRACEFGDLEDLVRDTLRSIDYAEDHQQPFPMTLCIEHPDLFDHYIGEQVLTIARHGPPVGIRLHLGIAPDPEQLPADVRELFTIITVEHTTLTADVETELCDLIADVFRYDSPNSWLVAINPEHIPAGTPPELLADRVGNVDPGQDRIVCTIATATVTWPALWTTPNSIPVVAE